MSGSPSIVPVIMTGSQLLILNTILLRTVLLHCMARIHVKNLRCGNSKWHNFKQLQIHVTFPSFSRKTMREKTEPDMIYELLQMFQCQKGSLITFFFVLLFWAKRKVFQKMLYCRNYDEVFFFFFLFAIC